VMFCFIYMILLEYVLGYWMLDVLFPYISIGFLWCLQYRLPKFKLSSFNYLIIQKKKQ